MTKPPIPPIPGSTAARILAELVKRDIPVFLPEVLPDLKPEEIDRGILSLRRLGYPIAWKFEDIDRRCCYLAPPSNPTKKSTSSVAMKCFY